MNLQFNAIESNGVVVYYNLYVMIESWLGSYSSLQVMMENVYVVKDVCRVPL